MIYAILKMMNTEKNIREGLAHFHIDCTETALRSLLFYMEELMRWNTKVNLTGIQDIERAVRELLYDAFFLTRHLQNHQSILDLGSGAGILAIPLAIIDANMKIFSIDKSLRKVQFQRHIKRTLRLSQFIPIHGRAEEIAPIGVDSLVVKAFGSIPEILEKGGIHIKPGGRALVLKGEKAEPVDWEGFLLQDTISYELPVISKSYKLFIYKKVS
jgi:16S rRNA (guanine527-N7)-methyltransferase